MAVKITDMDMPEDCFDCKKVYKKGCALYDRSTVRIGKRHPNCPLKPMDDVAPMIHAKWIKIDSGDKEFPESIVCSHCHHENSYLHFNEKGEPIQKSFITSNYCPHCGAKMDKE